MVKTTSRIRHGEQARENGKCPIAVQLGTHVANIQVLAKSRKAFEVSFLYSVYYLTSSIDQLPYENNFD